MLRITALYWVEISPPGSVRDVEDVLLKSTFIEKNPAGFGKQFILKLQRAFRPRHKEEVHVGVGKSKSSCIWLFSICICHDCDEHSNKEASPRDRVLKNPILPQERSRVVLLLLFKCGRRNVTSIMELNWSRARQWGSLAS